MSAVADSSAARPAPVLEDVLRDDGVPALAIGRLLGRALPIPALALLLAGPAGLLAAIALAGDDASLGLAAAVVAWLLVTIGASSARRPPAAFMWAVAPLVRLGEYVALLWLAAIEGPEALPAAFAFLAVLAYRHYDLVYRMRHRGDATPAWLDRLALGWDGRIVLAWVLLALGALPAAMFAWAAVLAVASVAETVMAWRSFEASNQSSEYEPEEDEAE
jgi:Family of unknown function (DUF5941)